MYHMHLKQWLRDSDNSNGRLTLIEVMSHGLQPVFTSDSLHGSINSVLIVIFKAKIGLWCTTFKTFIVQAIHEYSWACSE